MLYRGTKVALAGAFMNFALGLFCAWSVFAEGLIQEYGWTRAEAVFPYTLQLFVFSIAMIFAGRFQDRVGPRRTVTICGLASGITLTACGFVTHPVGLRGTFVSCGLFLFVAIILASRAMEIPHQENGLSQPGGAGEPVGRIDWRRLLGGLLCDRFGYLRNIRVALLLLGGGKLGVSEPPARSLRANGALY